MIALLIGLGDPRGFVGAKIDLMQGEISIIGPDDYDWHLNSVTILAKSEVIGTPLASMAFRVVEEIQRNDPEMRAFIGEAF